MSETSDGMCPLCFNSGKVWNLTDGKEENFCPVCERYAIKCLLCGKEDVWYWRERRIPIKHPPVPWYCPGEGGCFAKALINSPPHPLREKHENS